MDQEKDQVVLLLAQREADSKEILFLHQRLIDLGLWCGNVVRVFVDPGGDPGLEDRRKMVDALIRQLTETLERVNLERAETVRPKYLNDRRSPPAPEKVELETVVVPRDDPITQSDDEIEARLFESWKTGECPGDIPDMIEMAHVRKVLAAVVHLMNGLSNLGEPKAPEPPPAPPTPKSERDARYEREQAKMNAQTLAAFPHGYSDGKVPNGWGV